MTPDDQQPTSPPDNAAAPPTRRTLRAAERTRQLAAERAAQVESEAAARAEAAQREPFAPSATPERSQLPQREPSGEPLPPLPQLPGSAPSQHSAPSQYSAPSQHGAAPQYSAPGSDAAPASAGFAGLATSGSTRLDLADTGSQAPIAQLLDDDHEPLDLEARERVANDTPAATTRRRPRKSMVIISLIAVLAVGGAITLGWTTFGDRITSFLGMNSNDYEGTGNGTKVDFAVLEGDTGTDIGIRLADADIVKSSEAFIDAVLAMPEEPEFHPGAFQLELQQSAASALTALLDDSNRLENTVTIPEGTVMADVFALVEAELGIPVADLEQAAADPQSFGLPPEAKSLEGFLFPATYTFEPGTDAQGVLRTMVDRMFQALDEHGVPEQDRWKTVVLAALVQKEARLDEDFPKVARVFLNRVAEGMNLQSDATVAYGTGNTHRVSTTDEERGDAGNPYNTYVHPGLPVGPISNPGDVAIEAALHPAEGTWLFFVTWNLETGETIFSTTLEEHEQAVEKWDAWMEENPDYN